MDGSITVLGNEEISSRVVRQMTRTVRLDGGHEREGDEYVAEKIVPSSMSKQVKMSRFVNPLRHRALVNNTRNNGHRNRQPYRDGREEKHEIGRKPSVGS